MALIGTYELLPIHTHHFRARPVKLVIGKPIDPSGYTIRQADELTARLAKRDPAALREPRRAGRL